MVQREKKENFCPRCEEIAGSMDGFVHEKRCEECNEMIIVGKDVFSSRVDFLGNTTGPLIKDATNNKEKKRMVE